MSQVEDDLQPIIIQRKWHSRWMRLRIRRQVAVATRDPEAPAVAFDRFRQGLRGAMPRPGESGVIVAACNDVYYRGFAVTMLRSIDRLGAVERFHLHLCEPSRETESHLETLAGSLRHVRLSWSADDGSLARMPAYSTIYYAAARFLVGPVVADAADAPVLCIDIDGIARRPIWPEYEKLRRQADVILIKRPEERDPERKVLASAIGIDRTDNGRRFAHALARALAASLAMRPRYHVDQIVLHYLSRRLERASLLTTAQMPKTLADFDFQEGATIWTAKGWHRKKSKAYADAVRAVEAEGAEQAGAVDA